ncbi:hypothetical protein ACQ4PT_014253 [Festuca glaucescens]
MAAAKSVSVLVLVLCATTLAESCKYYSTHQRFHNPHSHPDGVPRPMVSSRRCDVVAPAGRSGARHLSVEAAGADAHVSVSCSACPARAAHRRSVIQRAHADAHLPVERARTGADDGRAARAGAFSRPRGGARACVISHARRSGPVGATDCGAGSCPLDVCACTEIERASADARAADYGRYRTTPCVVPTQTCSSGPVADNSSAGRHAACHRYLSVACINAGEDPDGRTDSLCR